MTSYGPILTKINNWHLNKNDNLHINGISPDVWAHLLTNYFLPTHSNNIKNLFFICKDPESAEILYDLCKINILSHQVIYYPGIEISPYGKILPSYHNLLERFKALNFLTVNKNPYILICTHESLALKIPPKSFFHNNNLTITKEDIIPPRDLATKLVNLGYSITATVEEPGTFISKGEIFDIFPVAGPPCRLIYYDDLIENIFSIDLSTNKTIKDNPHNTISLGPTPNILTSRPYIESFRHNIPMPRPNHKNRFERRKNILSHLGDGLLFDDFPNFISSFFNVTESLDSFINKDETIISFIENNAGQELFTETFESLREEYDLLETNISCDIIAPSPNQLYNIDISSKLRAVLTNTINIDVDFNHNITNVININFESSKTWISNHIKFSNNKTEFIRNFFEFLKEEFKHSGHIIFNYFSPRSKSEIEYLIDLYSLPHDLRTRISFMNSNIQIGFYYDLEKTLTVSEADLFTKKLNKAKKSYHKNIDLFAERLASIRPGDFVIHSDHGIGKFVGLESITINNNQTDYLIIEYTNNDKIYVPVYKINLVQKHADSSSNLRSASLRTNKFNIAKVKAKESAKKLAFDLIELQAERQSGPAFQFSPPGHTYKEFELAFPFVETTDQRQAIDEVLIAMQKPTPMDHLVCGDVGFGKTEVAMRAAFKAVLDNKQVSILVPTTILALQHFQSFTERFKNFPVNIEFISRFKSAKQIKEIKEKLLLGKIDIIIGTHKLLHSSIQFKSLGLVIIDEEQKFGVKHKEKLKRYKTSVDFMTLTATPIPRTLQLAFLGLRNLSLIQTPPPKRQAIKTYIIKQDDLTIQNAIKKEINRGGQIFFVHNRVKDIEKMHAYLKDLVPEASIVVGHGQLPESQLEKRITDFYMGKYQILLSTTIIESGLDIPNANTMIINRADRFGLSQLHQLRGRIGRSDRKAYAYFVIPNDRTLSVEAENRLKALQTYADMGSGFSLASCDLEFRGAGDILGAQQSGHIECIGLELYMELLQEAIRELKGKKKITRKDIEINIPFSSFIPNDYISDPSTRLKYYKRLSNCVHLDKLSDITDELQEIFGIIPHELNNLLMIINARVLLQDLAVKSLQIAGTQVTISFDALLLEKNTILRDKVVKYFLSHPKKYQLTPSYQVSYRYKTNITPVVMLDVINQLLKDINLE